MPSANTSTRQPDASTKRATATRRWIRLAVAAILLGALSNYVVVWGLILLGPPTLQGGGSYGVDRYSFVAHGVTHHVAVVHRYLGIECIVMAGLSPYELEDDRWTPTDHMKAWMIDPSDLSSDGTHATVSLTRVYGFPAKSLMHTKGELYDQTGAARIWRRSFWVFHVNVGRELPLMPVWLGFLANTAFYGALWVATLLIAGRIGRAFAAMWAWIERRIETNTRGKCAKCGYSRAGLVGDNAPCPECGHKPF